ncbi:MAG: pseudouridine synthase [Sedimentibacter saalensis]|jgi:23S rRNA pseudouridine2605 synthase|uniref:pseudouridine synthase n=1 Tax=Sedimentibacter saalensis TaxID=130788 RepID=UPI002B1F0F5A|nr:pseudouridine synthase [Sedimentibacter saalensis]MEA5094360.1 pseudouridine synthase [Sedimentibacter saalensis]
MEEERLQKYIARCGISSRRKAEDLILNGCVKVNGIVVTELGTKINPEKDVVLVDNKKISETEGFIYIKLYKPEGYVTTVKDQFGRKTVIDLVDITERIYPIGRLDYNTSGLLLLTNDGDLANKLMHPKYHIYKTYIAEVEGRMSDEAVMRLKSGVKIEDYKTAPAIVNIVKISSNSSIVQVRIYEGKNRQVRKMLDAVGHPVRTLKRISFGKINLGDLKPGAWVHLNEEEIKFLKGRQEG